MKKIFFTLIAVSFALMSIAQVGTIENITVEQRNDATGMVDIQFDLKGVGTAAYNISIEVSFDGGDYYESLDSVHLSGDTKELNPATGLTIIWNGLASHPDVDSDEAMLKITATLVEDDPAPDCGENVTFTYMGQQVTYGIVVGNNGTCWLDRNLGATRVAISSADSEASGDMFQWGRLADGHQVRSSNTTTDLSSTDVPGHANFIVAPELPGDWRSPQNDDLWQGADGINNVCPPGFRLPTEDEWNAERTSWSSNDANGAFDSSLKMSLTGLRSRNNGTIGSTTMGFYWSSTKMGQGARFLRIGDSGQTATISGNRGFGAAVRCIKD